ncbi:MAG: hypothetical protein H0T89_15960 [Deltaproteobacteria bacterium]|nr:hypothetical protein [Deltaproteobacteria bacterium]
MTTSKPESSSSPGPGDAPDAPAPGAGKADGSDPKGEPARAKTSDRDRGRGPVEVELEMSRQRAAGWTVFGLVVGALLIWKLGTVGVWVGVVLMIIGAVRAWQLVQTFMYAPGTIRVTADEVTLPRGLCLPRPLKVKPDEVTAVYFLRRSVPWNRSAPVLVVEIGPKAMAFPRDWFASEADQRDVVHALLRGRQLPTAGVTASADAEPA